MDNISNMDAIANWLRHNVIRYAGEQTELFVQEFLQAFPRGDFASKLLTPDILDEAGWTWQKEERDALVYCKMIDNLFVFIGIKGVRCDSYRDCPGNRQWLIRNTHIYSEMRCAHECSAIKLDINVPCAMSVKDVNNIFDAVKLSEFKLNTRK